MPEARPENDSQVMRTLPALDHLDAAPEERFDRLTRLARRLFDAPLASLSLVDSDRQWIKSRINLDTGQAPPEVSFCAQRLLRDDVLIVPDASEDDRFRDHPLVVDLPEIRFYAGCPLKAPDGSALGTLCVFDHEPRQVEEEDAEALKDLAAMVEQELRSLSLATMDELTGLTNRRGFDAIATQTIALCRRVDRPATLLLFDLDDFKSINDTLGHAAGDRVLREFAEQLVATFRDSDVIARLGGDEFCVLLSGATTRDIDRPLSNLRRALLGQDGGALVTFSVGAATYDPADHETVGALVQDADWEMYREKERRA